MSKAETTHTPDPDRSAVSSSGELTPWAPHLEALPLADTADDATARIIEDILHAESVDDLLRESKAEKLADWAGEKITIHDVRVARSTFGEGDAFAIVDFTVGDKAGEHRVGTIGGTKVLAKLSVAYQRGWLPLVCKVVQTASTANPDRRVNDLVAFRDF